MESDCVRVREQGTPLNEPFRDPEKAFERLRRAFRADGGIQKAFNQGDRARKALRDSGKFCLYDGSGAFVCSIEADAVDDVFCICVTADNYGPVAVKLDSLLEKEADAPCPWSVWVFDFESMLDAFRRKGLGPEKLREFLIQRAEIQEKAFTDDELEIVGAFILRGSLAPWIQQPADIVFFENGFSKIFDDIFQEDNGGPPAKLTAESPPVFTDYGAARRRAAMKDKSVVPVAADLGVNKNSANHRKRVGPCPCGSGKKFKRCCY